jgi:hypothetical protein
VIALKTVLALKSIVKFENGKFGNQCSPRAKMRDLRYDDLPADVAALTRRLQSVASMKDQHGRVRRHAQGAGKPETESHFPLGGYEVGGGFALASDARAVQSTAQYADEQVSQCTISTG